MSPEPAQHESAAAAALRDRLLKGTEHLARGVLAAAPELSAADTWPSVYRAIVGLQYGWWARWAMLDRRRGPGARGFDPLELRLDHWRQLAATNIKQATGNGRAAVTVSLESLGAGQLLPEITAPVAHVQISASHVLTAIRGLACSTDNGESKPLDLAGLDFDLACGLYESLLDFQFEFSSSQPRPTTTKPSGAIRKAQGSYYTPNRLVAALLDAAWEPLLTAAESQPEPEQALLKLRLCDPACGTGRFLIAAGRQLAERLARCRCGNADPSNEALQAAWRDVVEQSLFGVDLDPLAVALCRMALCWAAGLEERAGTLDRHIRRGHSLLGATPQLLAAGIPDAAYSWHTGDDRGCCTALRKQNRQQRQADPPAVDPTAEHARLAADAWCAAWVWPKHDNLQAQRCPTSAVVRHLARSGSDAWDRSCVEQVGELAARHGFFHWHLEFPAVIAAGGFDLVVGNPPFVNAIEGDICPRLKALVRVTHPELRGTADLAYYFFGQALRLVRPGGYVALVQPRGALNAAALAPLRSALPQGLSPRRLFASQRANHFQGAAVFVSLIVLGPPGPCLAAFDADPLAARWRTIAAAGANWWQAVAGTGTHPSVESAGIAQRTVADVFEVSASMTAGDAYAIRPHVIDRPRGRQLKLVTTGLIEPRRCRWGRDVCRYLKRDYRHPRIEPPDALPAALVRRLERARRPKLLVAGLSARVECFLDARGEYVGAVSTWSIFHPDDDLDLLASLAERLTSPELTQRFRDCLGGNALGGGNITMTKLFLQQLPWP